MPLSSKANINYAFLQRGGPNGKQRKARPFWPGLDYRYNSGAMSLSYDAAAGARRSDPGHCDRNDPSDHAGYSASCAACHTFWSAVRTGTVQTISTNSDYDDRGDGYGHTNTENLDHDSSSAACRDRIWNSDDRCCKGQSPDKQRPLFRQRCLGLNTPTKKRHHKSDTRICFS